MKRPARIALPIGDPHGIGPEIALRTAAAYAGRDDVALTVFAPSGVLEATASRLSLPMPAQLESTSPMPTGRWEPGKVCAEAGAAMIECASAAIRATRTGRFDAVVAGPHHETAVHLAGIPFSGYPSLLARVCEQDPDTVFLMLVGGGLHIVHATLHESTQRALGRLTPALVEAATEAGLRAMQQLGVARPRIGVFGIDPHAGESGLFGDADQRITAPAVGRLQARGIQVDGPVGADLLLADRSHDLYVAMFHDQGHIPVKLLAPRQASALSIGAEVILSSVGHGSAMDIAGRGIADPAAMVAAVARLAAVAAPAPRSSPP